MMHKPFKFILNLFIILIALSIVLYFSLKDNFKEIITTILNMNPIYFLIAVLLLIIYRIMTSITYYNIIKINNEKVPFLKCFQINLMILFFHGITPFSGGGQPMEIYYLHKESLTITKSTNITIQNFIIYQISLVIVGAIALIYNNIYNIFPNTNLIKSLVVLGFTINLLVLLLSFILSYSKKIQNIIVNKGIIILNKLNIIKDKEKTFNNLNEYLNNFHKNMKRLNQHKKTVLSLIILNILAIFTLYSIPYILSLGMNIKLSLINTIVATAYVMIIGSFIPIPGGTGGIEYGFVFFYNYLIKGNIANALMLVWRFITYYLGMIFGGVALSLYRKKEK